MGCLFRRRIHDSRGCRLVVRSQDYLVGVLTEDDLPGEEAVEVLGSYVPHQALAVDQVQSLREELWRIRRQEEEKVRR